MNTQSVFMTNSRISVSLSLQTHILEIYQVVNVNGSESPGHLLLIQNSSYSMSHFQRSTLARLNDFLKSSCKYLRRVTSRCLWLLITSKTPYCLPMRFLYFPDAPFRTK